MSKQFNLTFCTTDETCSKYFRKCLKKHQCYENLFFYESIIRFRKVTDIHLKRQTCLMIIQGFMIKGSSIELNITKQEKENSAVRFEKLPENECPNDFFDEYIPSIIYMINVESYPLFLKSYEFKEYFSKYGIKLM